MQYHPARLAGLGAALLAATPLPAQEFLLTKTSGTEVAGKPVGMRGDGADRRLVFATGERQVLVPCTEIIGLHGKAPQVRASVAAHLVGGDELKGEIEGGDDLGLSLQLRSAVLGSVRVPVDRVATLVFRSRVVAPEKLAIKADDDFDEALFLEAGRGLDVQGGELERFDGRGIHFARRGADQAQLFRWSALVGMAIRGGVPPKQPGDWMLVTVGGDRLRVGLQMVTPTLVAVRSEFGDITLEHGRIAALTRLVGGRRFLSDLDPARVAEAGSDSGLEAGALYPYRRDQTVSGGVLLDRRSLADGFLVAGGFTYAKGIGVHSRSVLTYRVPPGMTRFHARVAIDDEVRSLGVKGDADVRVRLGDRELFRATGLRRGQAPKSLGVLKVEPGKLLTLEVGFGKGLFLGDRVDWLSAVFLE